MSSPSSPSIQPNLAHPSSISINPPHRSDAAQSGNLLNAMSTNDSPPELACFFRLPSAQCNVHHRPHQPSRLPHPPPIRRLLSRGRALPPRRLRCSHPALVHRHSTYSFFHTCHAPSLPRTRRPKTRPPGRAAAAAPSLYTSHRKYLLNPHLLRPSERARMRVLPECARDLFPTPPRALRGKNRPCRTQTEPRSTHPPIQAGCKRTARNAAPKPRSQTRKIHPQQKCSRPTRRVDTPEELVLGWTGQVRPRPFSSCGLYCRNP